MSDNNIVLALKNIIKTYPGVKALNNVSLELRQGEVHALVGENGAGKSTLIKVCSGAIEPDSGEIVVSGKEYVSLNPRLSKEAGIGVIYQELCLVDTLSVAENIFMGIKLKEGFFIDREEMNRGATEIFKRLQISLDPEAIVRDISVGYQQIVAIAKAIALDAKILIMDEPSAPLTDYEVEAMFGIVDTLKTNGVSIIYISHRLPEIFRLSDRVTVLRDGEKIATLNTGETNTEELIRLMIGREMHEIYPEYKEKSRNEALLELRHLSGNGIKDISLTVYRGEIFGLAGLIGAGRTELAEMLFGIEEPSGGEMYFKGTKYHPDSPSVAIRAGIALMTEDRKRQGLIMKASIRENASLSVLKKVSRMGLVSKTRELEVVNNYVKSIRIKTPSVEQIVNNLSGGNQQKVVLAKWLAANPDLIIFDEPTRGIDVGAKREIYNLMNELIENGKTIIMISSEMEELIGMADRIAVLYEGKKTGELEREQFSQKRIMAYASGLATGID